MISKCPKSEFTAHHWVDCEWVTAPGTFVWLCYAPYITHVDQGVCCEVAGHKQLLGHRLDANRHMLVRVCWKVTWIQFKTLYYHTVCKVSLSFICANLKWRLTLAECWAGLGWPWNSSRWHWPANHHWKQWGLTGVTSRVRWGFVLLSSAEKHMPMFQCGWSDSYARPMS